MKNHIINLSGCSVVCTIPLCSSCYGHLQLFNYSDTNRHACMGTPGRMQCAYSPANVSPEEYWRLVEPASAQIYELGITIYPVCPRQILLYFRDRKREAQSTCASISFSSVKVQVIINIKTWITWSLWSNNNYNYSTHDLACPSFLLVRPDSFLPSWLHIIYLLYTRQCLNFVISTLTPTHLNNCGVCNKIAIITTRSIRCLSSYFDKTVL